ALCELLSMNSAVELPSDAAQIAMHSYAQVKTRLLTAICNSSNARRLLAIPELADDVPFCLQRDTHPVVAALDPAGRLRAIPRLPRPPFQKF
ncbi:MAG: 2-phosphosulfolactate phosphatase, partial [Verrucomicrobia bacterium]|nr:2-phosphosulfolactate phosphatase [Verrucomicrobiota bacterium]